MSEHFRASISVVNVTVGHSRTAERVRLSHGGIAVKRIAPFSGQVLAYVAQGDGH